ncbi:MAG: hypothetical protein PHU59_04515, partial [Candidatus Omnitrophica bacterium]|nr:hypothetical protein [Candidatus Omnitrophota bacterium]
TLEVESKEEDAQLEENISFSVSSPVRYVNDYSKKLYHAANLAYEKGDYPMALGYLEELILWDPQDMNSFTCYFEVANMSKDIFDLAFQKTDEIIRKIDFCPAGYYLRSFFHLKLGNFGAGLKDLDSAIRLSQTTRDRAVYLFEKAAYLDVFIQSGRLYFQGFDLATELNLTIAEFSQYDKILRANVTFNWEFLSYIFIIQGLVSKSEYQRAEQLLSIFFEKSNLINMQEDRFPVNKYIARAFDLRASIKLLKIEEMLINAELNWIGGLGLQDKLLNLKSLLAAAANDMNNAFTRGGSNLHGKNCLTYMDFISKLTMIEKNEYVDFISRISYKKSFSELLQAIAWLLRQKGGRRFNLKELREANIDIDPKDMEILKRTNVIQTIQDLPEAYYYGDMSVFIIPADKAKSSFLSSSPVNTFVKLLQNVENFKFSRRSFLKILIFLSSILVAEKISDGTLDMSEFKKHILKEEDLSNAYPKVFEFLGLKDKKIRTLVICDDYFEVLNQATFNYNAGLMSLVLLKLDAAASETDTLLSSKAIKRIPDLLSVEILFGNTDYVMLISQSRREDKDLDLLLANELTHYLQHQKGTFDPRKMTFNNIDEYLASGLEQETYQNELRYFKSQGGKRLMERQRYRLFYGSNQENDQKMIKFFEKLWLELKTEKVSVLNSSSPVSNTPSEYLQEESLINLGFSGKILNRTQYCVDSFCCFLEQDISGKFKFSYYPKIGRFLRKEYSQNCPIARKDIVLAYYLTKKSNFNPPLHDFDKTFPCWAMRAVFDYSLAGELVFASGCSKYSIRNIICREYPRKGMTSCFYSRTFLKTSSLFFLLLAETALSKNHLLTDTTDIQNLEAGIYFTHHAYTFLEKQFAQKAIISTIAGEESKLLVLNPQRDETIVEAGLNSVSSPVISGIKFGALVKTLLRIQNSFKTIQVSRLAKKLADPSLDIRQEAARNLKKLGFTKEQITDFYIEILAGLYFDRGVHEAGKIIAWLKTREAKLEIKLNIQYQQEAYFMEYLNQNPAGLKAILIKQREETETSLASIRKKLSLAEELLVSFTSSSPVDKNEPDNLVPEIISKAIAEKVKKMPVWELLSVLNLKQAKRIFTKSGPLGLTIRRIKVPRLTNKDKAPEGLGILPYELFDTTEFELLYNNKGYLIAIFPVITQKDLRESGKPKPHFFDLSEYYFEIPKFGDAQAVKKWDRLIQDMEANRLKIIAYAESAGIRGKLERRPRWTPYMYAHLDARDNLFPFVEAFYTEKFGLLVERREILNEDSAYLKQAILPVFPTVYHPGSHVMDDWKYILAVNRRLGIKKNHDVLVVGPGNGLDTWFVSQQTDKKIYAAGINPFEVANTKAVAKITGFKLEARIYDNIISEDNTPVFNKKFDWIIWNMPTYYPAAPRIRESLEEWEDNDYEGRILKRFARGLALLLKPNGVALIWNSVSAKFLDDIERILKAGGLAVTAEKYPGMTHLSNIEMGTETIPTALYFIQKSKDPDTHRAGSPVVAGFPFFPGWKLDRQSNSAIEVINPLKLALDKPVLVVLDVHGTLLIPTWKEEYSCLYEKLTGKYPSAEWFKDSVLNKSDTFIINQLASLTGLKSNVIQ